MTEREEIYIKVINTASEISNTRPLTPDEETTLRSLLVVWDEIMPLLVADIVKAVKKELQNVKETSESADI